MSQEAPHTYTRDQALQTLLLAIYRSGIAAFCLFMGWHAVLYAWNGFEGSWRFFQNDVDYWFIIFAVAGVAIAGNVIRQLVLVIGYLAANGWSLRLSEVEIRDDGAMSGQRIDPKKFFKETHR